MRSWLLGPLLFACVLSGYLLSFNVDQPAHNGDWYLRYQVTCAIVEHNSFAITPYQRDNRTGPGLGHRIYAQYTLGQSTAMIPLYLLGRRLAGLAHTNCASPAAPPIVLLTCKLLGPILGAMLAVLFYAVARLLSYPRRVALALTALLAFGSSLWPDVQSNLEHTMESLFLLAAAYAALRYTGVVKVESRESKVGSRESGVGRQRHTLSTGSAGCQPASHRGRADRGRAAPARPSAGWRLALPVDTRDLWLVVMGLAAGLVFVTRVAGVIALPIFAFYLVALRLRRGVRREAPGVSGTTVDGGGGWRGWRRAAHASRLTPHASRLLARDLAFYGAGVLPSLLINAAYDAARFGSPLKTGPYPDQTLGYPPWLGLPNLLVSPGKGLLWYTPALLLLALAARPFYRRLPLPAVLCALICSVYLLFYANVTYWHGDPAWGPRYLYATLPYLVLPLGEVFARWRGYRRPLRAVLVGVLALSVLIQFSAVSVSYWRSFHDIFATYPDQIDHYSWGFNLNYFWKPEQSPLLLSLQGIAGDTRAYVDGAPLVRHSAREHLGAGNESCLYPVYHKAAVCLTDVDDLRARASLNTFTLWWLHTYPWWSGGVVAGIALALLALFLATGLALSRLTAPLSVSGSGEIIMPEPRRSRPALLPGPAARASAALGPLAAAALIGALLYGSIVATAAVGAPRRATPLVRMVAAGRTVVDGELAYRILGLTRQNSVPDNLYPAGPNRIYAVVRLWLRNLSPRRRRSIHPTNFMLADPAGDTMYQWPCWLPVVTASRGRSTGVHENADAGDREGPEVGYREDRESSRGVVRISTSRANRAGVGQTACPRLRTRLFVDPAVAVSELYHLSPAWFPVPPRGAAQRVLVYVVPTSVRRFILLGPGVTLTHLNLPPDPASVSIATRRYVVVLPAILAVRQSPTTHAPVVNWLVRGTDVRVAGRRGAWVAVTLSNHAYGYVPRRDVRLGRESGVGSRE